ncbi:AAA family ATPase [Roseovarius nanhaiticus]|uniref:AAA family ATPase n=1 Tax=Roseovarius nanhaiticus TaxID=573024 RepID=UPI00249212B3|nr:AAA family ATPase [Roseovarius nanhaiticus]
MSRNDHKARIGYLLENSEKSIKEILDDGLDYERFVKQQAHRYPVAHLKDVLHRMKKSFGLVETNCNHIQTDRDELERDVVMYDLREFLYTNDIGTDNYIVEKGYQLLDVDLVRYIGKLTTGINTFSLQQVLNEKQLEADVELDAGPQKRPDVIKKLSTYMDSEEARDRFKKDFGFHESVYELEQADLIMYLNSEISDARLDFLPCLFDKNSREILDLLEEFFNAEELLAFEAYAKLKGEDERKAEEIEQDKEDRIARDVKEQCKLDENGGYADFFDDEDGEGEEEKPTVSDIKHNNEKYKRFMHKKKAKKASIAKIADKYRFKYVLNDVTSSQLPKNTKENITAPIKKIFGNIGAHELTSLNTLNDARKSLALKYPHGRMIIDSILNDVKRGFLFGKREIQIRPILLVGDPGNGKSSLARDLMKALDVYVSTVNVGGMSEINILGVSSGYFSAMPSIITTTVANACNINPCIVIDEIDKASKGSHNGDISAGLLSLLEPSESSEWYEKFLNLHVNASHVNWILTANDIDRVPLPLVSRCTVYRMENPDVKDVGPIVQSIVADYAAEVGVDPRFFRLSAGDIEYLRETMPRHRSVRILRELVRLLLDEQESSRYHA